jgi:hypothetical protein
VHAPTLAEQDRDALLKRWAWNALLVLRRPVEVFAGLAEGGEDESAARGEPVLALTLLAGMAGALMTPQARTLLDDGQIDGVAAAIWIFIVGSVYGLVVYWLLGGLVYLSARAFGSDLDYRRCRQLLAYSCAPLALSLLVVFPLRLIAFGADALRSGGSDSGAAGHTLDAVSYAFIAWSALLLVVGVRSINRWRWQPALGAVGLALALLTALFWATHQLG